ncbi:MAG: glycoside hydrolase family 28 protein [Rikenellaceae bacterium]|nr:glycoside hydrolase family 28 protein [Rikenellaceae bacterium]
MRKFLAIAAALLLCGGVSAQSGGVYNVRDFGAKGDGVHIDSDAVNEAIGAAVKAGGGTVWFPAGIYSCYSIRLQNHITLRIDNGAVIKAAVPTKEKTYDLPEENAFDMYQDFGHSHWKNSLIWGIGLHDITIEGAGLIDGSEGITRGQAMMNGISAANKAIALKECYNVTIRDISMLKCGHFALLLTGVDNLTLDNLKVDTNRDAFDVDCCANVRISNCYVNTLNDDAIVLKSSYGLGYAKPTENVTITNCQVSGYDPGTLLDGTFKKTIAKAPDQDGPTGRIKFGTESNGGFKNITISNCVFDHCRGLALETVDGGIIEDITISNIAMRDIQNAPIYIRLGNRARGPKESTPVAIIRRVKISDVVVKEADCRYASIIAGIPGHPIEDVTLSNIYIQYKGGLSMKEAAEQPKELINNFFTRKDPIVPRDPYAVPDRETDYPEPATVGILPAYGLYVNHAVNLKVNNVEFETIAEDKRPVVVLMDVDGVKFNGLSADKSADAPFFVLRGVKGFSAVDVDGMKDIEVPEAKIQEIKK